MKQLLLFINKSFYFTLQCTNVMSCINNVSSTITTIKKPYSLKNRLPPNFSHSTISCVFHVIPKYPFLLRKTKYKAQVTTQDEYPKYHYKSLIGYLRTSRKSLIVVYLNSNVVIPCNQKSNFGRSSYLLR